MEQSSENILEPPTRLQQELLGRIIHLLHEDGLAPGARLNESQLAQRLNVSRTPVRAALEHLAGQGFVARQPHRGMALVRVPPRSPEPSATSAEEDDLLVRLARDHGQGRLPIEISETELMRLYGLGRQPVRAALDRLADLDVVERKPGYGWRFLATIRDTKARAESYRFRILIETAAILEPGFKLAPDWIEEMRRRHHAAATEPWTATSSVAFFEMNAAFHEGVAAGSGNRYLFASVRRQNRLRRLSNYYWRHGRARVLVNCREHLEILDRLEAGDQEIAAALMRRHLETASHLAPSFSNPN